MVITFVIEPPEEMYAPEKVLTGAQPEGGGK